MFCFDAQGRMTTRSPREALAIALPLLLLQTLSSCSDPSPGTTDLQPDSPAASKAPVPGFQFRDEARERGLTARNHCGAEQDKRFLLEEIGNGCAFLDYDGDGDLDAYLVDAGTLRPPVEGETDWQPNGDGRCRLYENDGRGYFEEVSEQTSAGLDDFGVGVVAGDYDNDGDPDLYVTCFGPNRLLRNDAGRFTDVAAEAGVDDGHWGAGAVWLDANQDGHLDLYVANYFAMAVARDPECWRKVECPYHDMKAACGPKGMVAEPDRFFLGQGDGTFVDATAAWTVAESESRYGLGVVAFDQDSDGDTDVYVANDSRGNYLFDNEGDQFWELGDLSGVSLSRNGTPQAGMGIACGDLDGDLDQDLFLTNFSHDLNTLYRNEGHGEFLDVTEQVGLQQDVYFALGWGTEFVDFDNDGSLELFVANGHVYPEADQRAPELTYKQLNRIYGYEDGKLIDLTLQSGPGLQKLGSSRGAAFGDIDNDGDVDVLVVELNEAPTLLVNDLAEDAGQALTVNLVGTQCNRDAVGARVVVEVGGKKLLREKRLGHSFASCNDPRLHIGTGTAEKIDRLVVNWPGGAQQEYRDLPARGAIQLRQGKAEFEVLLP
jgi:hypothetical protein